MKKQFISAVCISTLLLSGSVSAETYTKNVKGFDFNITTPSLSNSKSVKAREARISVNKAAMKAQIDSINSKINSISGTYQSSVNNLANNLLPTEQLKKLNEEKAKIKSNTKSGANINIEIAEDGSVRLNKYLKSSGSTDTFKNLTLAQKTAVKKDLNSLRNVSSSYSQVVEQSKTLISQIKADPAAALELKSDLTGLVKNQTAAAKQVKSISKLTSNLVSSAAKAGLTLK